MPVCGCGKTFPSDSSMHFHRVRSRQCVFTNNSGAQRNKRRKNAREPDFNTASLPPSLGGLGNIRTADNIFFSPGNECEGVQECASDGVAADSIDNRANGSADAVVGNWEEGGALDINDATDDQLVEVFCHLVIKLGVNKGKAPMNRLLDVMTHPRWTERDLSRTLRDTNRVKVADVQKSLDKDFTAVLREDGFEERRVDNPNVAGEYVKMWWRDPVKRLQAQLLRAVTDGDQRNFYLRNFESVNRYGVACVSHPMNAKLANRVIPEIRRCVEDSSEAGVSWTSPGDHSLPTSTVLLAQAYSDVSMLTLSTTSAGFYPFQLCTLNFSSAAKDTMVCEGEAVVAYLPTDKTWRRDESVGTEHQRGYDGEEENADKSETESGSEGDVDFFDIQSSDSDSDDSINADRLDRKTSPNYEQTRLKAAGRPSREIYTACVSKVLDPLKKRCKSGISYTTSTGEKFKGHVAMASMVADIPEVAHASGLKNTYCNVCTCRSKELNGESDFVCSDNRRDQRVAMSLRRRMENAVRCQDVPEQTAILKEYSAADLHPVSSPFEQWPFSHIDGLSMYQIFRFDYMHTNPIGLSVACLKVVFKRMTSNAVLSNNRSKLNTVTGAIDIVKGARMALSKRKTFILNSLNNLCVAIDRDSPCTGFRVDFGRQKMVGVLNGLFTDKGVITMLQAKHLKYITQILPFIGALADRLSQDLSGDTDVDIDPVFTDFMTTYADMDAAITKKDQVDRSFTAANLDETRRTIEDFANAAMVYEVRSFQKSGFNFLKFHKMRSHCVNDIEDLGGLIYHCSSPFETSHTSYKEEEKGTSHRIATGVSETVAMLTRKSAFKSHLSKDMASDKGKALVYNFCTGKNPSRTSSRLALKLKAIQTDKAQLVSWVDMSFRVSDLQTLLQKVELNIQDLGSFLSRKGMKKLHMNSVLGRSRLGANRFTHQLGGPYFLAFPACGIIRKLALMHIVKGVDLLQLDLTEANALRHRKEIFLQSVRVTVVKSLLVPGFDAPTMSDLLDLPTESGDGRIGMKDSGSRHMQRVVATDQFSHGKKRWQDSVIIETKSSTDDGKKEFWVAKVLAIVKITAPTGHFAEPTNQENVVLRYYSVIPREDYTRVDKCLGCVKLRWAVTEVDDPWIDLQPVRTVRGRVHVITDGTHAYSEAESSGSADMSDTWSDRLFYLNRFKVSNYEALYMISDMIASLVAEG